MKVFLKTILLGVMIFSLSACGKAEATKTEKTETKKQETKAVEPEDQKAEDVVSTPYGEYQIEGEWQKDDWTDNIADGMMCGYTKPGEMVSNEVWISELKIPNGLTEDFADQINESFKQNYQENKNSISSERDINVLVTLLEYPLENNKTAYLFQIMDENNQIIGNKYHLYHQDRMIVVEDKHSTIEATSEMNEQSDKAAKSIIESYKWPDEL